MGISKRELLRDYYPAELPRLMACLLPPSEETVTQMDAMSFFGAGGEVL